MPRELNEIVIQGARQHNLKNITVKIPKRQLIVFTGVSGSGKSSLAFDTLYAEGQRRYIESLSSYARQFLGQMEKPLYDHIRGIAPTISVEQKAASNNPRSTVGTVTEIHDYLRVLYARVGQPFCPGCGEPVSGQSAAQIVRDLEGAGGGRQVTVLARVLENRKGEHKEKLAELRQDGFTRLRVDGEIVSLRDLTQLDKRRKHTVDVVVDRVTLKPGIMPRLTEAVELALRVGDGSCLAGVDDEGDRLYSEARACPHCNISFPELTPQLFSFNSPQGMCHDCNGLGTRFDMDPDRVVPDQDKSIAEGAIEDWGTIGGQKGGWTGAIARAVAQKNKIPLDKPWRKLTAKQRKILLYGTGQARVPVSWKRQHAQATFEVKFEGVIPTLLRRMGQTQSERAREYYRKFMSPHRCASCDGTRLRSEARHVRIADVDITALCQRTVEDATRHCAELKLTGNDAVVAEELLKEIRARLGFLLDVGLGYLTLDRLAPTLSGGEGQRIRLASQIGSELTGVVYVLDEPSIGLHQRDNRKLLSALRRLRDIGNTVVVVEHDRETMEEADHLIDFGPGAGHLGGEVVAKGKVADLVKSKRSLTGQYLSGQRDIEIPAERRPRSERSLVLRGARANNLKSIDAEFPLGVLICVSGVSGAGKSTLINQTLLPKMRFLLNRSLGAIGDHDRLEGIEQIDKVIAIDQSPIGRTSRSNPATYTKVFDEIRSFFAKLPESRMRGFQPGRFSFNVKGGRCESCSGDGYRRVEMHFLADVFVSCEVCQGRRFNDATLEVRFRGRSIADVLALSVDEALELFQNHPGLKAGLTTLHDVGLGYIHLGQPSPTLSGGEAQRIKLSRELSKRSTGKTVYVLDEPTTGLHFEDIRHLLEVLNRLVDGGNTVIVIEHNLDVIKTADWIIDIGPEGGQAGGYILAAGTPEQVAKQRRSVTGRYLSDMLPKKTRRRRSRAASHSG